MKTLKSALIFLLLIISSAVSGAQKANTAKQNGTRSVAQAKTSSAQDPQLAIEDAMDGKVDAAINRRSEADLLSLLSMKKLRPGIMAEDYRKNLFKVFSRDPQWFLTVYSSRYREWGCLLFWFVPPTESQSVSDMDLDLAIESFIHQKPEPAQLLKFNTQVKAAREKRGELDYHLERCR